jgi:xanthine phosphoribosyltransferase
MASQPAKEPQHQRPVRAISISWDELHRDARSLAALLANEGPFHVIVSIARGGLVPAAILARELGIRFIDTVCVASYQHANQGEVRLLKGLSLDIMSASGGRGKGVLVVDDLVDTGRTAQLVRGLLPDAHFAAIYAKPSGRPLLDTFVSEVPQDTWIHFPWDTGLAFLPPLRDDGT